MSEKLGLIFGVIVVVAFVGTVVWALIWPPVHIRTFEVDLIGFHTNDEITYVIEEDDSFTFQTTNGFITEKYFSRHDGFGKIYTVLEKECGEEIYLEGYSRHQGWETERTFTIYSPNYCEVD